MRVVYLILDCHYPAQDIVDVSRGHAVSDPANDFPVLDVQTRVESDGEISVNDIPRMRTEQTEEDHAEASPGATLTALSEGAGCSVTLSPPHGPLR